MNVEYSWIPPLPQKQAEQPHLVQASRALLEPNFFSEERTDKKMKPKTFWTIQARNCDNSMSTREPSQISKVN